MWGIVVIIPYIKQRGFFVNKSGIVNYADVNYRLAFLETSQYIGILVLVRILIKGGPMPRNPRLIRRRPFKGKKVRTGKGRGNSDKPKGLGTIGTGMKSTTKARMSATCQAYFDIVDGRSVVARRFKENYLIALQDMGGNEHLSIFENRLAKGWAAMATMMEKMITDFLMISNKEPGYEDIPFSIEAFIALNNAMSRQAKILGLKRAVEDITPKNIDDFTKDNVTYFPPPKKMK